MQILSLLLSLSAVFLLQAASGANPPKPPKPEVPFSRSWGDNYAWNDCSLGRDDLVRKSKEMNKPVMWILFWQTGCDACYHLQGSLKNHNEVQRLSQNFLLVNCKGDEIPDDADFYLDGEYSPKIVFTDVQGQVRPEYFNKRGKPEFKYYYVDGPQLEPSMREAAVGMLGKKAEL
jgi:hypothetical protein